MVPLARQVLDDVEHLADQLRVERRGRLVEEQHFGAHGERPGDGDALLLPAGQLPRVGSALSAARRGRAARGPRLDLACAGGPAAETGASTMFSSDGQVREEVEVLEDEPDPGALPQDVLLLELVQLVALAAVADQVAVDATKPRSTFSRWLMVRSSVDLPEPDGPRTTVTSPG